MKNIEASVGVIPTQVKKEEVEEEEEEEYTEHENEMYFFLRSAQSIEYRQWAGGLKTQRAMWWET